MAFTHTLTTNRFASRFIKLQTAAPPDNNAIYRFCGSILLTFATVKCGGGCPIQAGHSSGATQLVGGPLSGAGSGTVGLPNDRQLGRQLCFAGAEVGVLWS